MKEINGDLILTEDTIFDESVIVHGDIKGKDDDRFNLIVKGNLNCYDLNCGNLNCEDLNCEDLNCGNLNCEDLNCYDLDCMDLDCRDLNCEDLNCEDLNCGNLNCDNLSFYAVAIAYHSFKCSSWKAIRDNYVIKCLDSEIEIKDEKKYCDKCGQEIK